MKKPGRTANRVLLIVGVLTLAALTVFFMTHWFWYDCLRLDQRVSFWAEALVAYGTLALAIVTWGSVRESQDVLAGEDLRFRQARMPMIKVVRFYRDRGGIDVGLVNHGVGPARNVRVTFDAHTIVRWNEQGLADNRDKSDETHVEATRVPFSSYMPKGKAGESDGWFAPSDPKPTDIQAMNAETAVSVKKLIIEYEDVFGSPYITKYEPNSQGAFSPALFEWNPPLELIGSK